MSKKNRYKFRDRERAASASTGQTASSPIRSGDANSQHVAEYKIISKDLIRLIILNGVMLIAVLVLYYTNRSSGYLEKMFQHLL